MQDSSSLNTITMPNSFDDNNEAATIKANNMILWNSLTKVQTYAEKIINHRLTSDDEKTTKVYNLYLKCLRNPNKIKLANIAENVVFSKIHPFNNDTFKIL